MKNCPGCKAKEIWREHPNLTGLWISNRGQAFSEERKITQGNRWGGFNEARIASRIHKLTPTKGGYLTITFDQQQRKIHVLVLECFVGPRPGPKWHGCHRDDVGSHNCLTNLRWDTPAGNMADLVARNGQGRMFGDANPLTTISVERLRLIKKLLREQNARSVAIETGVSEAHISRIKRGLSRTRS